MVVSTHIMETEKIFDSARLLCLKAFFKSGFDPAENSLPANLTSRLSLLHHHEPEGDSLHRAGASR
jgi:hypothetical protein